MIKVRLFAFISVGDVLHYCTSAYHYLYMYTKCMCHCDISGYRLQYLYLTNTSVVFPTVCLYLLTGETTSSGLKHPDRFGCMSLLDDICTSSKVMKRY